MFGRFERIVVHSERGRDTLAGFGVPTDKLRVIPHAVSVSDPERRDDGRTVLALGMVRPYKQIEHAADAARAAGARC
jgi:glycosyltransferase involved in cell wall biosynthesis